LQPSDPAPPPPAGVGLSLIVGYKLTKASLQALAALALVALVLARQTSGLQSVALWLRDHATAAWSVALADRLARAVTRHNLLIVAIALAADAVLSLIEGWALHRRHNWARWLVVGASALLLPFEVLELIRRVTAGRVAILLVNTVIVIYLIRRRISPPTKVEVP